MSGWEALFAGLGAGGNALAQLGMMQIQHLQKQQDEERENKIWMQRQRMLESMKAPAERSRTIDNPDKPGQKLLVREVWQPPADDNTPGKYQEVGREPITPKYVKDKRTLPGNKEEDILVNENDPTDVHAIPGSAPRDIYDPEGKVRTGIEGARLGLDREKAAFDRTKWLQEQTDKKGKDTPEHERYSYHLEDDGTGKPTGYAFDKFTGQRKRVTEASQSPGGGLVADMAQQAPDPGAFAPKPDVFSASPLSQFDRAPAGNTPPSQGVGPSGGAGSQGSMSAQPAKGAAAKGPPVAKKVINGVLWYKYADGSTAPSQ
jgi:hypothetical protein